MVMKMVMPFPPSQSPSGLPTFSISLPQRWGAVLAPAPVRDAVSGRKLSSSSPYSVESLACVARMAHLES